jgi:hypothetical protein
MPWCMDVSADGLGLSIQLWPVPLALDKERLVQEAALGVLGFRMKNN